MTNLQKQLDENGRRHLRRLWWCRGAGLPRDLHAAQMRVVPVLDVATVEVPRSEYVTTVSGP